MPVKLSRRKMALQHAALAARCDEYEVILAALALQFGVDGCVVIPKERVEDVLDLSGTRTIALRRMSGGSHRLDFTEPTPQPTAAPDLEMTVIEEAPCS